MNRKELVDMIVQGTSVIREFLREQDDGRPKRGSMEDWNANDIVGHICGWMDYSKDKLSNLKLGTPTSEKYKGAANLNEINALLYEETKGLSTEAIESRYLHSLGEYLKILSAFSEEDINSLNFNTGFNMALWRYMLMDTVIHPVLHVLYQRLKLRNYEGLAQTLTDVRGIFNVYSQENRGLRFADLDFDISAFQERFAELQNRFADNEDVAEFVRVNRPDEK